jgi:hypothetical protein
VDPDLELERASRRPTDEACHPIGEENMRDESHEEADDAHAEHQSVEKQEANNAAASPRKRAEPKVYQGKRHA